MAKKKTTKKLPQSFTLKGDEVEMAVQALELCADISEDMLNDAALDPNLRGCSAFDMEQCHDIVKRIRGGK